MLERETHWYVLRHPRPYSISDLGILDGLLPPERAFECSHASSQYERLQQQDRHCCFRHRLRGDCRYLAPFIAKLSKDAQATTRGMLAEDIIKRLQEDSNAREERERRVNITRQSLDSVKASILSTRTDFNNSIDDEPTTKTMLQGQKNCGD